MSLPLKAIDRLFDRMTATYGRDFTSRFDGVDQNELKAVWSHELSGFADKLGMIAWALENLPERAPNVIEFRNLCRKAPAPEAPRLPTPKADPARVAAELAKLAPALAEIKAPRMNLDHKAWAKRLMARNEVGDKLNPTTLRFAKEALAYA
jgi:hypothetical protein